MTAEEVASAAELSVGKATGAVGACPPLHAASTKFNEIARRQGLKQARQGKMSRNIKADEASLKIGSAQKIRYVYLR
jgi:hypothetical protein